MNSDWKDSVVLIKSSDSKNQRFGTGFIIHHDKKDSYVLTCDHVIKDVGGNDNVVINKVKAKEVVSGEKDGIDLSVVRIEGLSDKIPLKLSPCVEKGISVLIFGFQLLNEIFLTRPLDGKLGNQIGIWEKDGTKLIEGWDLLIDDYQLQHGYSGSPVIEKTKEYVAGVVSHRIGEGEKGIAISIGMIKKVWSEMPQDLLNMNNKLGIGDKMTTGKIETDKKNHLALQIEKIEKWFVNARYKQAYEAFFELCKSYPDFVIPSKSILSSFKDFCKDVEMGIVTLSEQHNRKQQIAHSFQMCLNRFKEEQQIG